MRQIWKLWAVGGDRRQCALAAALAEDGHEVHTWALERGGPPELAAASPEGLAGADAVILPLPAFENGRLNAPLSALSPTAEEVLALLRPGQLVCAGQADAALEQACLERGLRLADYFRREELAVANAVPTGEGAIQLALEELPVTLHGAAVLILGYGRLGRVLARQLRGLGSRVTVAARRPEARAWAEAEGCRTAVLPLTSYSGFCLVISTVPAPVLGAEQLSRLDRGSLVLDLASPPGGVDLAAARTLGVHAVRAGKLPGKTAPVTAGRIIRDAVLHIIQEEGV